MERVYTPLMERSDVLIDIFPHSVKIESSHAAPHQSQLAMEYAALRSATPGILGCAFDKHSSVNRTYS